MPTRLLSSRIKKNVGASLAPERYEFLSLENAEPDFGFPTLDNSVMGSAADGTRFFFNTATTNLAETLVFRDASGDFSTQNITLAGSLKGPATFTIDPETHGDNTGLVQVAGNLTVLGENLTCNALSILLDDFDVVNNLTAGTLLTDTYLRGPADFVIDPFPYGDIGGTVRIQGDLVVEGTQTTINSTTLTVDDLNIVIASGAVDALTANGAGITIDLGTDGEATLLYGNTNDDMTFNKNVVLPTLDATVEVKTPLLTGDGTASSIITAYDAITGTSNVGSAITGFDDITAASLITSSTFESVVTSGTSPLVVASDTKVDNLNADLLDGLDESDFVRSNVSDNYTNGTLTFDASTGLTIADTATVAFNMADGTTPFTVASTTKVTNLNADLFDDLTSTDFDFQRATDNGATTTNNITVPDIIADNFIKLDQFGGNLYASVGPAVSDPATDYKIDIFVGPNLPGTGYDYEFTTLQEAADWLNEYADDAGVGYNPNIGTQTPARFVIQLEANATIGQPAGSLGYVRFDGIMHQVELLGDNANPPTIDSALQIHNCNHFRIGNQDIALNGKDLQIVNSTIYQGSMDISGVMDFLIWGSKWYGVNSGTIISETAYFDNADMRGCGLTVGTTLYLNTGSRILGSGIGSDITVGGDTAYSIRLKSGSVLQTDVLTVNNAVGVDHIFRISDHSIIDAHEINYNIPTNTNVVQYDPSPNNFQDTDFTVDRINVEFPCGSGIIERNTANTTGILKVYPHEFSDTTTSTSSSTGALTVAGGVGVGENLFAAGKVSAPTLESTIATGTAPLTVTSTTLVSNLNADSVDDLQATSFIRSDANDSLDAGVTLDIADTAIVNFNMADGTTPFTVASTTLVSNLNADKLDDLEESDFIRSNVSDNYTNGTLTFDAGTSLTFADTSTVAFNMADGTTPFTVASTTLVSNLNADTVDDKQAIDFTLDYVTGNGATTTNDIEVGTTTITGDLIVNGKTLTLTVQDDTLINEYYIYVGNPVNKLSAIQDYRQVNTGLAYDQEFAYLDQAFKFIMENPIDEVGTIDPSYGNTQRKAVYVIALEESVAHYPNPTTDYDSFDLWNVNHQILLLNQNALNPTPATAECYAVIGYDLKIWGIPLFQPATKDLRFAGRLDATDCHIRTANNAQGFDKTFFEDDIWITNSYFRLNNCDFKPVGSKQIGIWDNSVADIDLYAVDEASGTLKLSAISSVIAVDQNASNISLREVTSWDNSVIRFTSDVTVSGTISVSNSEIRVAGSLTFNGASARFNLEHAGKVIYQSVNSILSTSHIMGGDSISHPDAQPFLDLSEASWKDGVKTINAGAAYNQIGQYRGSFRLPNLDTTARNSLTAANGDMIYNTTVGRLQGYQEGAWIDVDDVDGLGATSFIRSDVNDSLDAGVTLDIADTAIVNFNMATGTSPFTVDSTTKVDNLNVDLLDGLDESDFLRSNVDDNYTAGVLTFDNGATVAFANTTGTAPFTVASTTVVTNLNADTLDGLDESDLLRSNVSDNYTTGTLTFDSGTTLDAADGATVNFSNAIGAAPFTVVSTTKVDNLNADLLDGLTSTDFTLDYVTDNGNSTTNSITVADLSADNISTLGYLRGPANFIIDPATHGDNTGLVEIAGSLTVNLNGAISGNLIVDGDLTVSGSTTTVSATNLNVSDNKILLNASEERTIADAVGDGVNVVYTTTENHTYFSGEFIDVSGVTPSSFDIAGATIISVTSNTFTVASTVTDTYVSGGISKAKVSADPDIGFVGEYDKGNGIEYTGIFRDATDERYKIFHEYTLDPNSSVFIDTTDPSFALADLQANDIIGNTLTSTVADGTAPLTVTSTTLVSNLNADLLDGKEATEFTLDYVTGNGAITTNAVTVGDTNVNGILTVTTDGDGSADIDGIVLTQDVGRYVRMAIQNPNTGSAAGVGIELESINQRVFFDLSRNGNVFAFRTEGVTTGNVFSFDLSPGAADPVLEFAVALDLKGVSRSDVETHTSTTTTSETIATFKVADFTAAKLIIKAIDTNGDVQVSEVLLAHDSTTPQITEYAIVHTSANPIASYTSSITGGTDVIIAATAVTANTEYTVVETLIV